MTQPQPCGTVAAFWRHKRRGEQQCPADLEAARVYFRERRRRARTIATVPVACRGGCGRGALFPKLRLCAGCHKRWVNAGRPDEIPPAGAPRMWRKEDYAELTRDLGESLYSAAERMGISVRTARRYEAELRVAEAGVTERRAA